jgi:hypothetical protein
MMNEICAIFNGSDQRKTAFIYNTIDIAKYEITLFVLLETKHFTRNLIIRLLVYMYGFIISANKKQLKDYDLDSNIFERGIALRFVNALMFRRKDCSY